jgi:hypothetical protein
MDAPVGETLSETWLSANKAAWHALSGGGSGGGGGGGGGGIGGGGIGGEGAAAA